MRFIFIVGQKENGLHTKKLFCVWLCGERGLEGSYSEGTTIRRVMNVSPNIVTGYETPTPSTQKKSR